MANTKEELNMTRDERQNKRKDKQEKMFNDFLNTVDEPAAKKLIKKRNKKCSGDDDVINKILLETKSS